METTSDKSEKPAYKSIYNNLITKEVLQQVSFRVRTIKSVLKRKNLSDDEKKQLNSQLKIMLERRDKVKRLYSANQLSFIQKDLKEYTTELDNNIEKVTTFREIKTPSVKDLLLKYDKKNGNGDEKKDNQNKPVQIF